MGNKQKTQRSDRGCFLNACFILGSVLIALFAIAYALFQYSPQFILLAGIFQASRKAHELNPHLDTSNVSPEAKVLNTMFNSPTNPLRVHLNSTEETVAFWRKSLSIVASALPSDSRCVYEESTAAGTKIYNIRKKDKKGASSGGKIFYLHGGGFILGTLNQYRSYTCQLVHRTGFDVIYIDYPLAPDDGTTIRTQVLSATAVIKEVGYIPSKTFIVGDSAGGGMTLLVAQRMYLDRMEKVAALGLISPFIDLKLDHELIQANTKTEYVLTEKALGTMAFAAVGKNPSLYRDPCCNAFQGSWSRLPPIVVASSDSEILHGDALLVVSMAQKAGIPVRSIVGKKMVHVWIVADGWVPESTEAGEKFAQFLLSYAK